MGSTHEEDQTDKQGVYQRKGSDRELITVIIDNWICVYGGIATLDYLQLNFIHFTSTPNNFPSYLLIYSWLQYGGNVLLY